MRAHGPPAGRPRGGAGGRVRCRDRGDRRRAHRLPRGAPRCAAHSGRLLAGARSAVEHRRGGRRLRGAAPARAARMKPVRPPWEERIAVAALALLLVITLANVFTRYFTDDSFAWTEELSVFLMVVLALAGAAA